MVAEMMGYKVPRRTYDGKLCCLSAVIDFYRANGIRTVLDEHTPARWMQMLSKDKLDLYRDRLKPVTCPEPLDMLILTTESGKAHVGVYLGAGRVLHTRMGRLVVTHQRRLKKYGHIIKRIYDVRNS